MPDEIIGIRGGGDLGSACALRLWRCGFRVLVAETPKPTAVRRTVAFSEAVFDGQTAVEESLGVLTAGHEQIQEVWEKGMIAVAVDPDMELMLALKPAIIVDAVLAKRNTGMRIDLAPGTIGLGPGFIAGVDVHAVVETNRGPDLGRVIWTGEAQPNTSVPAPVSGHSDDRVLRAPASGVIVIHYEIGDRVQRGDVIAEVGGNAVTAPFDGLVRGLIRVGLIVRRGMKVGDLDPRLDPDLCHRVSDKALAVAGGVLEAALMLIRRDRERASTVGKGSL